MLRLYTFPPMSPHRIPLGGINMLFLLNVPSSILHSQGLRHCVPMFNLGNQTPVILFWCTLVLSTCATNSHRIIPRLHNHFLSLLVFQPGAIESRPCLSIHLLVYFFVTIHPSTIPSSLRMPFSRISLIYLMTASKASNRMHVARSWIIHGFSLVPKRLRYSNSV